ncbi:acyltransferase family protein [Cellulomonas sp. Root137]|uniref:acyltransferase family protein n=1 Tax=Cellulomonas sp. Root137 TaxID=1736459 RepID=UPI0006F95F36|nr:acyltransferase family protein [Cellulomonas sp. Root137]KQY47500.1 hypothetical protein ASD18_09305 [Cellulomonas sp. Root137]
MTHAAPDTTTTTEDRPVAETAPGAATTRPTRRGAVRTGFRPDIEGLRALAVGLVIVSHAFGFPAGGFVGVDVFFVISGFLITGLLLKEHARTGRISFADFYRRRARRILPMSTLVLVLTVGASYALYFASRAQQIAVDGLWSLLFSANWRFAAVGTDYFASAQEPSPLQHYWSLAVEEQFYFVWPWILLAMLAAVRLRRRPAAVAGIAAVTALILVADFVFSAQESTGNPTVAYFSTFSRAWELLLGALLAVATPYLVRLPSRVRPVIGWAGFLAICAGAFLITPTSTFPAPWAALPVLGAGAVILAGTREDRQSSLLPLTNPVAGYLGKISYSLYLWHWPVIILLAAAMPVERRLHSALAVVIALGLSVLSFHLVEDPIRRSRWLEPRAHARTPARQKPRIPRALVAAALASVVLAVGTVGLLQRQYAAATPAAAIPSPVAPPVIDADDPASAVAAGIQTALAATEWPELNPTLDAVAASQPTELNDPACVNNWDVVEQHCVYGPADAENTALVIGDSTAIAWLPALQAGLIPEGWNVDSYGKYGCPSPTITIRSIDRQPYQTCDEHRDWAFEQAATVAPDLVVFGSAEGYIDNLPDGSTGAEAEARWTAALEESIDRAAPIAPIVVLSSPPSAADLTQCATRTSRPADCVTQVHDAWYRTSAAEKAAVTAAQARGVDVTYIDTSGWVCSPDGLCPGFVDGIVVRSDINHLTGVYSTFLGPLVRDAVLDRP